MTSSLTQPSQLTFNTARFLPIDLSQPAYGLYPAPSTTHPNITHFVQSSFFCKDLQEPYVTTSTATSSAADPKQSKSAEAEDASARVAKIDYGPQSDSDSCSNSSRTSQQSSSSPQAGGSQSKVIVNSEKKRKELVRDSSYYLKRQKNNVAAKRSRDSRRRKEDEVAMRTALLEQENFRLRFEVERLKGEIDRHRIVAFNSKLVAEAVVAPTFAASIIRHTS